MLAIFFVHFMPFIHSFIHASNNYLILSPWAVCLTVGMQNKNKACPCPRNACNLVDDKDYIGKILPCSSKTDEIKAFEFKICPWRIQSRIRIRDHLEKLIIK